MDQIYLFIFNKKENDCFGCPYCGIDEAIEELNLQMNKSRKSKNRILLVEDEESLAQGLQYNLIEEGYEVQWVNDGQKAIETITHNLYDLIILDVMLPYFDGFEVAEEIRRSDPKLPILILTARTRIEDKLNQPDTFYSS